MSISQRDKKHIWHPLNQHKTHPESIAITHAENCTLFDENGKEYIDGIASWYTAMYGHCNPYIIKKVTDQLSNLNQIVFSGFTHEPAVKLSEKLINILPTNQTKVFFSDNGSTAVEVGIKMGLQYFSNQKINKTKIIAFKDGFHGDTFGAMAASAESIYNRPFKDLLLDIKRISPPTLDNEQQILNEFESILKQGNIACFVYEPLVQGAAGMKMHNASSLNKLLELCKQYNVITIADEVMTGFGKTGKNFASDYMENKPDIICLSKALTAGVVPMAITSCSQKIYDAFYSDDVNKGFFHAHTYSANPVACSAAIAGIELLESDEIQNNIKRITQLHTDFSLKISNHPKVKLTRQLGVIFALEVNQEEDSMYGNLRDKLFHYFIEHGVYLRPLGNTIYILPPFTISDTELLKIYSTIEKSLDLV
jgi:adenosylmethionine-8-amino-7-oxononanoate aminotransferase